MDKPYVVDITSLKSVPLGSYPEGARILYGDGVE